MDLYKKTIAFNYLAHKNSESIKTLNKGPTSLVKYTRVAAGKNHPCNRIQLMFNIFK